MTKFVEDNRNWSLYAAQLSFNCFSGLENHVPRVACKMFSILIHYLYMAFFLWTGNVMNSIIDNEHFLLLINSSSQQLKDIKL